MVSRLGATVSSFPTQIVENRLKLTQSFHLKLTHPVTA